MRYWYLFWESAQGGGSGLSDRYHPPGSLIQDHGQRCRFVADGPRDGSSPPVMTIIERSPKWIRLPQSTPVDVPLER